MQEIDEKIIETLNSRKTYNEIAGEIGADAETVKIRLGKLAHEGIIIESPTGEGKTYEKKPANKNKKTNVLVTLATIAIMLILLEAGLRIYYLATDKTIAGSEFEAQEKALYKQLTNENDPTRFLYGKSERWDNDELLGLVPKAGRSISQTLSTNINETHKAKIKVYEDHFNSLGMATFDEMNKSKNGKTRIAVLGDSFALGDDVLPKFSFANLLPKIIQNSEVINYGMSGKGTSYMYTAYKKKAVEYSPDIVIMSIMIDDLSRNGAGEEQFRQPEVEIKNNKLEIKEKRIGSYREFFNNYKPDLIECYTCKFISYKIERINYKQRCYDYGLKTLSLELDDLKKELGKKLIVAIFVSTPDLDEGYALSLEIYNKTKAMLEEKEITYLDGKALFEKELPKYGGNETQTFYKKEASGHFSETGCAVFALGLKDKIKENKLASQTLEADKAVYSPEGLALFFVDSNKQIIRTITAYDLIEIEKK
jgi:hypothetical protein